MNDISAFNIITMHAGGILNIIVITLKSDLLVIKQNRLFLSFIDI